ncbi:MAG: pyridoxal-phosphate dependent enzyme [Planctomycetota bacterium]
MSATYATSYPQVLEAARRLRGVVHRTPVMTCEAIDRRANCRLFFKCENLQKVGAFKYRGASHALLTMEDADADRGVVTHSSGNHAQALALAGVRREIPTTIVMPTTAPAVKRAAVAEYGATIVDCEPTLEARETTAAEIVGRTGATFVHPYDNERVIEGQGTATLELLEEVEDLDTVVIPVGGGGLLAGGCLVCHGGERTIRVLAAEPAGADDAARSFQAGERLLQTDPNTIADGLLTSLGERNWPIIRDHVEQVVTVSDDEIVAAMRLLWERAKLVVEPSGAVPLAAVLKGTWPPGSRVGVILSGGNVDLTQLPW